MQQGGTPSYIEEEQQILDARTNPDRFNVLYERYYSPILKFVYQRVVTKDDAYDITQQVFLQAMLSLHKYQFRGLPFSSWLYRIAINEMNQLFRKNEKQRGINLEEKHLAEIVEEMHELNIDQKEQVVLNALTTLGEDEYQIIEMRFFEKRPFKEIGEILNISEATAKMRIYRILERIKPLVERGLKI
jgi:RNA polymerase sigma-70 factor (ECF subfamily)